MHRTEIVDLLSLIATYDQRTVGQADVEAWFTIAEMAGWSFPLAQRAVAEYHVRGGDKPRIKPGHITDALDRVREAVRRNILNVELLPPLELADDPRAEIEWRRDEIKRIKQGALDEWAQTGALPRAETKALPAVDGPPKQIQRLVGDTFALPRGTSPRRTR